MCGRFSLVIKKEVVSEYFEVQMPLELEPLLKQYNIAPTETVMGITHDEKQQKQLLPFRWGLIPYWIKQEKDIRLKCINAKVETVATSTVFKYSFKKMRCIIPATSFFEWKDKQPYLIEAKNKHPLAFAGLWSRWENENKSIDTCCIITMDALGGSAKIHHRMPLIIDKENFNRWLDIKRPDEDLLMSLTKAIPYGELVTCPVTKKMNRALYKNEDAIKCL